MAQVNIFVSSTCYDLSQIRHDIKQCILDFGHNPILSEMKNFPIDPNLTSSENCINTVKSEADIFIFRRGDTRARDRDRHAPSRDGDRHRPGAGRNGDAARRQFGPRGI